MAAAMRVVVRAPSNLLNLPRQSHSRPLGHSRDILLLPVGRCICNAQKPPSRCSSWPHFQLFRYFKLRGSRILTYVRAARLQACATEGLWGSICAAGRQSPIRHGGMPT